MTGHAWLVDLQGVSAAYGKQTVLEKIDLRVGTGEWVGIIGPNGSGKSTLLATVVGRHQPSAGRVVIEGMDLAQQPTAAKGKLGFAVPPETLPADLTGQQCIDIFAMSRRMLEIDEPTADLAQQLGLTGWLHREVGSYSLGTRQKLAVVLAVLGNPPLLVFDEVFNGLDPAGALTLKRCLQARVAAKQCSVVLATHALDTVELYCTYAYLLSDGRIRASWNASQLERARRGRGHLESEMAAALSTQLHEDTVVDRS